MRRRFRLPSPDSAQCASGDLPPVLQRVRLDEPFSRGTALLFPINTAAPCAYTSSLEDAAMLTFGWDDELPGLPCRDQTSAELESQTGALVTSSVWATGFAVGGLPLATARHGGDGADTTALVLVATSWAAYRQADRTLRDGAWTVTDPTPSAFTVVPTAAVRVLGPLSCFFLRSHGQHAVCDALSRQLCLVRCLEAEAGHAANQAALLALLFADVAGRAEASANTSPVTLYHARPVPNNIMSLRSVHLVRTSPDAAVTSSTSTELPPSLSPTVLLCAPDCGAAAGMGLSALRSHLSGDVTAAGIDAWTTLARAVQCLTLCSPCLTALRVEVHAAPSARQGSRVLGFSLHAVVDGALARSARTATIVTSPVGSKRDSLDATTEYTLEDADVPSWRAYFAAVDDLFALANNNSDTDAARTQDDYCRPSRNKSLGLDRFCALCAHPTVTPEMLWAALAHAVDEEFATADGVSLTENDRQCAVTDALYTLGTSLWAAGVTALESMVNADLESGGPQAAVSNSTFTVVLFARHGDVGNGVLPPLVAHDRCALLADSEAEGTEAIWRTVAGEAAVSAPSVSFDCMEASQRVELQCLTHVREGDLEGCVPRGNARSRAIVDRLLRRGGILADHIMAWLSASGGTRPISTVSSLPLAGPVDVVYCLKPACAARTMASTDSSSSLPFRDCLRGLTQILSLCPSQVFSFPAVVQDYLLVAAYGQESSPSALAGQTTAGPRGDSALPPRDGYRGLPTLFAQLLKLHGECRHRAACQLYREAVPSCRTGLLVGTSYAVLSSAVHAQLTAWRCVGERAGAALLQRVGRGLLARRQVARQRGEKARADGDALRHVWEASSASYWTAREAQRTALLTHGLTGHGAWSAETLKAAAGRAHNAWLSSGQHAASPSLTVLRDECGVVLEEAIHTISAWRTARQCARRPVVEKVEAYEAADMELFQGIRQRRAHHLAVHEQQARDAERLRRAEAGHGEEATRRAEQEAVRETARRDALRREARRELESQLIARRARMTNIHEHEVVQDHLNRQAQRFQTTSALLTQRRRAAARLALDAPTASHLLEDGSRAIARRRRGTIADRDGLVHSALGDTTRHADARDSALWDVSRDLAALSGGLVRPSAP